MTVIPFRRRQPEGTPVGGQFAATAHPESTVSLVAAPAPRTVTNPIPESLHMAHVQDEQLVHDLAWEVQQGVDAEGHDYDYRSESFGDRLSNLNVEESYRAYDLAVKTAREGGDWEAIVHEVAAADTAAHPGGTIEGGYHPPYTTVEDGYGQGALCTGERYNGFRDAATIAKDVRQEIKKATEGNWLPKGLTYSVRSDRYSGGQAIAVEVRGLSDQDRIDPQDLDQWGGPKDRKEARELVKRIHDILSSYNRTDIDSMSDYYSASFHANVRIESDRGRDFREREAAAAKAKRAARAS